MAAWTKPASFRCQQQAMLARSAGDTVLSWCGGLNAERPQPRHAFAFFFHPLRGSRRVPISAPRLAPWTPVLSRLALYCGGLSRGRMVRDRGAVDAIAVGRARASAASKRATRGFRNPDAPTAEQRCFPSTWKCLEFGPPRRKRVRDRGAVEIIAVGRARRAQRASARPADSGTQMRRPRSGRIGFAVRTVRISIFGQK